MQVLIGLGANIGDPPATLSRAVESLGEALELLGVSRLYRTRPVGPPQPDYWNMAVLAAAGEPLIELLARCQRFETAAGRRREREERWGPRHLDLDLLMAREAVHRGPRLLLPHPQFHSRAFALVPAAELAPSWIHPHLGRSLEELAREVLATDPGAIRAMGPLSEDLPPQSSGKEVNR